jgi:DNA-binding CsgD family transcriptional regulator
MQKNNFTYFDLIEFASKYTPYNELPASYEINIQQSNIFKDKQFLSFIEKTAIVIHVFDFYKMKPIYYSKNIESLSGYSVDNYEEGGLAFMISLFHSDHVRVIQEEIMPKMIDSITRHVPLNKVMDLKFAYNFKTRRKDGEYIWILHQMTILETDETGFPILGLYLSTDITNIKKDETIDLLTYLKDEDGMFKIIEVVSYSSSNEIVLLSTRELEVLSLLKQGKSSQVIANDLFISPHTVNNHRKKMLEKTKCKNTAELLDFSQQRGYFN